MTLKDDADGLFEFLLGSHKHLSQIIRYSTVPKIKSENVAEHSFFVTLYVQLLCELAEKNGYVLDKNLAIKMAIVHDLEESISSDLPYNIKRSSKGLKEEIEKINRACMWEIVAPLPKYMADEVLKLWKSAHDHEDGSIEAKILDIADRLSTIVYCYQEISLGNKSIMPIFENATAAIERSSKHLTFMAPINDNLHRLHDEMSSPNWIARVSGPQNRILDMKDDADAQGNYDIQQQKQKETGK